MKKILLTLLLTIIAFPAFAFKEIPSVGRLQTKASIVKAKNLYEMNKDFYRLVLDKINDAVEWEETDARLEYYEVKSKKRGSKYFYPNFVSIKDELLNLMIRHLKNKGYTVEITSDTAGRNVYHMMTISWENGNEETD